MCRWTRSRARFGSSSPTSCSSGRCACSCRTCTAHPPYGVAALAEGSQERVAFSEEFERGVARTMAEVRRILATAEPPRPRWVGAKCRACGYHPVWCGDGAHQAADGFGAVGG